MKYHLCDNVILEQICGTHLLIACGEALIRLEYVRVLNEVGADVLEGIRENRETEEIILMLSREYDVPEEEIRPGIIKFLTELEEKGYLLREKGDVL